MGNCGNLLISKVLLQTEIWTKFSCTVLEEGQECKESLGWEASVFSTSVVILQSTLCPGRCFLVLFYFLKPTSRYSAHCLAWLFQSTSRFPGLIIALLSDPRLNWENIPVVQALIPAWEYEHVVALNCTGPQWFFVIPFSEVAPTPGPISSHLHPLHSLLLPHPPDPPKWLHPQGDISFVHKVCRLL